LKKALIVGIDTYPNSPLTGCINDANAVAELLRTNGDGSPNFDVKLLTNTATKAHLLTEITELFAGVADVALLYFAGHGSPSGHLVTPDYQPPDYGVSQAGVLAQANASTCRNKIIILDCCFSGQIGESPITQSTESTLSEGVTILTASSRNEVSMEVDNQGLFTSLFLQGLRGSAADVRGQITPAGIYSFIDQSLGAWQQRPLFKTNTSQFLPIRRIEPRVPEKTLRKIGQYFNSPSDTFPLDPSFEFMNAPEKEQKAIEPYANPENVEKFKELQMFASVGLVEPVGEEYMYFAAMNGTACKLTALGLHYWNLSKESKL